MWSRKIIIPATLHDRKSQGKRRKVEERCNGQANHHICQTVTRFVVWPGNEKRRHECWKGSNNDEGGREETSTKAQTEVDGQSASDMKEHQLTQSSHRTEKHGEMQS